MHFALLHIHENFVEARYSIATWLIRLGVRYYESCPENFFYLLRVLF